MERSAAARETMDGTASAPTRAGPAWVGIGAQRSGTTWFAEMMCQHPEVDLGSLRKKETHFFERFLFEPWSRAEASVYRLMFTGAAATGEFTPGYLRSLWVAPLLRDACGPSTRLIVLLRDPVERFRSAMRWAMTRPAIPGPERIRERRQWMRRTGNQAIWAGMYATQLAEWVRHFQRENVLVLQYERVAAEPAAAVAAVWHAMGVRPAPVTVPTRRTWNSTGPSAWCEPRGLADQLRAVYLPEVERLREEWDVDPSLWPHFA